MINWETIKTESITNINDIVDDSGAVLLNGLSDTKKDRVDLKAQCQFNLDNYKLSCVRLSQGLDDNLVSKATTYIG